MGSHKLRFCLVLALLILTGCMQKPAAYSAVENYLKALVAKDTTKAVNYSCAAWEEQALAEGSAFEGVTVELDGLQCQTDGTQANNLATVSCTGKFVYSYAGGENMEIPLDGRVFQTVFEANQWKMCGYAQ
jgi:hypothetical protein